jgi:ankyrin repeat protein
MIEKMKRRRIFLWITVLLLILVGLPVWLVQRQIQQERLDDALLAAVTVDDSKPDVALLLLEQGANPNTYPRPRKVVPLWERLLAVLQFRTAPGDRVGNSAFHDVVWLLYHNEDAAHSPWNRVLEAMLKHGADPNTPIFDGDFHVPESTPLMRFAGADDLSTVRLLLKYGANPHYKNRYGDTALKCAVLSKLYHNAQIVQILLQHGVNPNERYSDGSTLLHALIDGWGTAMHRKEILKNLLAHGAQNLPNTPGETPLDIARREGFRDAIEVLQEVEKKRQKP